MHSAGWKPCRGIGGRLGLESVAAFPWNRWQACYGISGRFGVEYALANVDKAKIIVVKYMQTLKRGPDIVINSLYITTFFDC